MLRNSIGPALHGVRCAGLALVSGLLLGAPAVGAEGTFTVAALAEPPSAESIYAYNANSRTVMGNIYESLVGRDADNAFVPELATSWEQLDDRTWRFEIRQGVKFHDGSDLTAQGAAEALNWVWAEENGHQIRAVGGPNMTFSAIDDDTIEVQAEEPDPLLLTRMWQGYVPSIEQITNAPDTLGTTAVGTGPYKQGEWSKRNFFKVVANPDWWGLTADDAYGKQYYAEAMFLFRPESSSRIAALQAGEVDLSERLPGELCKANLGDECVATPDTTTTYLRLDSTNPVLADRRIREAMSLAIDRQTIGDALLGGAQPAKMIVGPSATGYNASLPDLEYNMERAKALIAEARADGVPLDENTLHLKTMQGGFVGNTDVMEVLLEQFKLIGLTNVDAEVRERGPAWVDIFVGVPQPVDPDRALIAMHKHTNDPYDFAGTAFNFYGCKGNVSVSCNPRLDELREEAASLVGVERQRELEKVAELAYADMWLIPMNHTVRFHGLSDAFTWTPPLHAGIRLTDIAPR